MAGVAALVVAGVARLTAKPVEAANGGSMILGQTNTATAETALQRTGAAASDIGLSVTSDNGFALFTFCAGGAGIRGDSTTGVGLAGTSPSGTGLIGSSQASIGVYGSASGTGVGVRGDGTSGPGVAGNSTSGSGVTGFSSTGIGVVGATSTGYAAQFSGRVLIGGDLTVTGIKSAAVPHPDGSLRRVYCVESPQSYFEDFGEIRLKNGAAYVRLDPDFRAIVRSDDYQVFLTEYGDSGGLYVAERTSTGFRVHARDGASTASFGYRVVARRADIEGPRLEKVERPRDVRTEKGAVPGFESVARTNPLRH